MKLIDDLRAEHERIDRVLGSLRSWAIRFASGEAALADRGAFVHFFTVYAGAFHHEREEDVLFQALTGEGGVPADRGPIAVLLEDHQRMGALLARIGTTSDPRLLVDLALEYSHALWMHIDAENSVLFPESERELRRSGVVDLPSREPSPVEVEAAALGDALIVRYPPIVPDAIRGDGCAMCHAWGAGCRGPEREWWNEWEWEELSERLAAG